MSPDKIIPIEVKEFEKPKIKIDLSEYKPKIHAEIKLEGDITSIPSRIHYEDLKMNQVLEQVFEKFIEKWYKTDLFKAQELKVDILISGEQQ